MNNKMKPNEMTNEELAKELMSRVPLDSNTHDDIREAVLRLRKMDVDREKEYEYSVKYINFKRNKCVGMSAYHYKTREEANNYKLPMAGEKAVVVRREVGEWEEVLNG